MRSWTLQTDGKENNLIYVYDAKKVGVDDVWKDIVPDGSGGETEVNVTIPQGSSYQGEDLLKEFPYHKSWKQLHHRVLIKYANKDGVLKEYELRPATLCNWLEQTNMYMIAKDPKLKPGVHHGVNGGLAQILTKTPKQILKMNFVEGQRYWLSDLLIGSMNIKTTVKKDMNFVTMHYFQGLTRIEVTKSKDNNRFQLSITSPAPFLPGNHGKVNTAQLPKDQYTIILEGTTSSMDIPIHMDQIRNPDEAICFFGYQDHYPQPGPPVGIYKDGTFSGATEEGAGWCQLKMTH